jgi:4-hydroxy-3-methylbut-2-enyl diphosphate reductase
VAEKHGAAAYMLDNASQLKTEWLAGKKRIGVTAGASAPEVLVREVITRLEELSGAKVTELDGKAENVSFPLPKALQEI